MKFSDNFKEAAKDYLWLLNKNYPQKKVLSLVGDRYRLLKPERDILYRGISSTSQASSRREKLYRIKELQENTLHVDMLNVVITITSYLGGKPVFFCNDGWVRDSLEIHAGKISSHLLRKALNLILEFSIIQTKMKFIVYIDHKAESGKQVLKMIDEENGRPFEIKVAESADHLLKVLEDGVLATSDGQLIDQTNCKVVDLAREILEFNFSPEFYDLERLISVK